MARYKVPDPSNPGGPSAASLLGKIVAVVPLTEGDFDTRNGRRPGYRVALHEIIVSDGRLVDVVDLGETTFFQDVLLEKCRYHDPTLDGYLIGRIVKPNRAYLLDPPTAAELPLVEKAVDLLPALGSEPAAGTEPTAGTDEPPPPESPSGPDDDPPF